MSNNVISNLLQQNIKTYGKDYRRCVIDAPGLVAADKEVERIILEAYITDKGYNIKLGFINQLFPEVRCIATGDTIDLGELFPDVMFSDEEYDEEKDEYTSLLRTIKERLIS
jgi:hypothetical protein